MLKLLMETPRRSAALCMKATMALESMPPDRNTPSGTSDIICASTTRVIVLRRASTASASLQSFSGTSAASQ